nr:ribonuclease H-like domain, reverse transcriptase, RNA-dependent DNA polymerase [Tanacetum cinerariifolium]
MSDHEDETITAENAPPKNVPQIITVTNISAKFHYLKKGEYDIWAMKMQNLISSSDLLCWNIVLKGNIAKSMTTDTDGNLKIRPPITAEEHQQNAIKARFSGNTESKKMQKSLLKQRVSVSAGDVVAAAVSPQSETEFAFMGLSTEGQPIYNRFASVDHMKAVPPPLTGNYMPPSNILDIDESQMVYGKKATDSSEIKTNDDSISHSHDSVLFYFSDRNAEGKGILGRRPTRKPVNQNSPKPVSAGRSKPVSAGRPKPVSAGRPKPVSAGRPNPVSAGRPKPDSAGRSKPVFAGRPKPVSAGRPNPVFARRPNPVSADQPNPVSAGQPNIVFAGDGILGVRPLNFQPKIPRCTQKSNAALEFYGSLFHFPEFHREYSTFF